MNGAGKVLLAMGLILFAALLQVTLAPRMNLFGGAPDFVLVAVFAVALTNRPSHAAWAGFWGGLLIGALSGASVAYYILTRGLVAFGLGYLTESDWGPWLLAGVVMAATLVAQIMLMFVAPPTGIPAYLQATILSAVYNAVLAVPLILGLRRVYRPTKVWERI